MTVASLQHHLAEAHRDAATPDPAPVPKVLPLLLFFDTDAQAIYETIDYDPESLCVLFASFRVTPAIFPSWTGAES